MKNNHNWGIKVFARAGVSGIVYHIEVHIGNGTTSETTDLGISGAFVMRLSRNVPEHRNYKIYTDNLFTTGTVRLN